MNEDKKKHSRTFTELISRTEARRLKARKEKGHGLWFGLGMFGMVGWAVAVPALAGVALGIWIDRKTQSGYSWTLMLLLAGIVIGCINAWYWIRKESKGD